MPEPTRGGQPRACRIADSATRICSPVSWPCPPQTGGATELKPSNGPSAATAARMIRPRERACERPVANGCRRPRATRARPARAGLVPGGPLASDPGDDPVGRGAGERPPQHARGLHRTRTTQAVTRPCGAGMAGTVPWLMEAPGASPGTGPKARRKGDSPLRGHSRVRESIRIVTGPSLTRLTCMSAPNTPRSGRRPVSRSRSARNAS